MIKWYAYDSSSNVIMNTIITQEKKKKKKKTFCLLFSFLSFAFHLYWIN